ncbi:putative nucleotidyltransferase [Agrobacterium rubi TR3 = NBRC 13261]|uniref:Putative nucleotidyltransferase n=2 Tax=Agrobacterium rubi TaxID=28099 RepID=A0A081D3D0_9HYPH|nr:putative nucleotidyltransferase [Agrobacterium rubi TR3 = NBRC 13261]
MLSAVLLHPDVHYGSNELIAIGGSGNGAGRRILDQFEASGVVVKHARGNQRLYSANRDHPVFQELRSICVKTFGIAKLIAEELAPFRDRISLAFVFGSIARGSERADSDIDLMVIGEVDLFELGEPLERLHKALGREIDLNLHKEKEWADLQGDRVIESIMKNATIPVFKYQPF